MAGFGVKQSNAQIANANTLSDYYNRIRLLALSVFEWQGLPESINHRYLEQTLFEQGKAIFVYDKNLGYLALKTTPAGKLNVYGEPVAFTAYSVGYTQTFGADDCTLIRNNYDMIPTSVTCSEFAQRLTEAERSTDVNIKACKTPLVIICDEKQRLTLKNLYRQHDGNEPVIFGDKSLNIEGMKVLNTNGPFLADKLMAYKRNIWNEMLTFLGINNANTDKKERLITDEVEANNEAIMLSANAMLLTRLEACKEINRKFGLNISCGFRKLDTFTDDTDTEPETDETGGGDENE